MNVDFSDKVALRQLAINDPKISLKVAANRAAKAAKKGGKVSILDLLDNMSLAEVEEAARQLYPPEVS